MFPTASLSIAELLSGPYLLNIPVYQRPYSWGREQAEQLFEDLVEAASLDDPNHDDSDYFLGTILLMDTPGNKTTKLSPKMTPREFDVVDGQQRLVTLMTLFAILRDLEADPRGSLGRRVKNMLVAQQRSRFFRTERFRLHLGGTDRSVFEQYILQPNSTFNSAKLAAAPMTASETALIAVRDTLRTLVSEMPSPLRIKFADYVADQCRVVIIVSHDIDRAHRTFVVLNERGKRLQRNDILKADILSRLPSNSLAPAVENWDRVSLELGDNFEAFFAHLRAIYGYARPQIVSGVRAVIRDAGGAERFFGEVFLPLARAYALIRNGGQGILPQEMQDRLVYLNRLPDGDWAPAVMLVLKDWERDPAYAQMLLAEIDRFAHLMRMLCSGTGKRVRRFADVVAAIRSGQRLDPSHPAFQLTREEVRNIAFHLKDFHKRNPKVCKLVLLRLSDILAGAVQDVDPDLYTIEHVLPQRPSATSEWRRWFPTAEERGQVVESLGNLVLITQPQNDKARNASWDQKKEIYATSGARTPLLAITSDVLDTGSWLRFEIEAREQRLLEMIEQIWRISLLPAKSAARASEKPLPLESQIQVEEPTTGSPLH